MKTMTVKDLAEYLHITPNHVRDLAVSGRIPEDAIVKPPGCRKYLFDPEKIKRWARYIRPKRRARLRN